VVWTASILGIHSLLSLLVALGVFVNECVQMERILFDDLRQQLIISVVAALTANEYQLVFSQKI
jgi:hypothetical protein